MRLTITGIVLLMWLCHDAQAAVIVIEGTLKSVDGKKRTITVETGKEAKTFDVSSKAKVTAEAKDVALDSLKSGQKVKLSYHDELEIVLKIEVRPEPSLITFDKQNQKCDIRIGDSLFASYIFQDNSIRRPFFANVHSLHGHRLTRKYPPVDDNDHATTQPGLSLGFADLDGADFWSNASVVRHVQFIDEQTATDNSATFAVKNSYEAGKRVICSEECRYTLSVVPEGILLTWDSAFLANEHEFTFGDSKEMGLSIRVATPLAARNGGRIVDSEDRVDEKGVWGKQADWCQYSGMIDGQQAGVLLMPDPKNIRKSWFHVRDYGLLTANPFGRFSFTKKNKSVVTVKVDQRFRLRFGVFIWDAKPGESPHASAIYRSFLKQIAAK